MVDVQAIGRTTNGHHFCPQFAEQLGGNQIRSAMGCINHDFLAFERQIRKESTFTKLDVTTCGIIQALGFAQRLGIHPDRCLCQFGFNSQLPSIIQLGTCRTEKFDAIVVKRVVTGTDDHAQIGPQGLG